MIGDDAIVFVHDLDGVCQYASPGSATTLGRRPDELVGERTAKIVHRDDRALLIDTAFDLASAGLPKARAVVRMQHRDGHHLTLQTESEAMRDDAGELKGFRTVATVLPPLTLREPGSNPRQPANAPLYDATGAATMALLDDRLQLAAQRLRRQGEPFAVLWVRLHVDEADDGLTRIAVRRMLKLVRRTDTVACFDRDDLAVLCAGASLAIAMNVAERAVRSLAEPVGTARGRKALRVTVGVAPANGPVRDPNALLRAARDACCDPTRVDEGDVRLAT
jgi:PAS domain S-box-containing protein